MNLHDLKERYESFHKAYSHGFIQSNEDRSFLDFRLPQL